MTLEVHRLVKRYGDCVAVDRVSFGAEAPMVLGLLGRNGAGKSTVMRVLSGYLTATAGRASIAGYDVQTQSMDARARLGYLPESGSVYPEMRVSEYLAYRADLKRVPASRRRKRIDAAVQMCDLGEVRDRIVGQLSKGFRQRVALAGTLLHEPPVLILDEPTVGLDPVQMREMRALVRRLGRDRTVLFSTHILSEAESVCDRVIILQRGKLVADATPAELTAQMGAQALSIEIVGPPEAAAAAIGALGEHAVELQAGDATSRLLLTGPCDLAARERISRALLGAGAVIVEMAGTRSTLDEAFVRLTEGTEA